MSEDSSAQWAYPIVVFAFFASLWAQDKSAMWRDVETIRFVGCSKPFDGFSCPGDLIIPKPIRYRIDPARAEVVAHTEGETPTVLRNCIIFDAKNWKCGSDEMKDGELVLPASNSVRFVGWWEYWARKILNYVDTV